VRVLLFRARRKMEGILRKHGFHSEASAVKRRQDLELKTWMLELAADADPGGPLPDPHLIWWKAQLRERLAAGAKATRPIRVMEAISLGIGVATAVLAAVYCRASPSLTP